MSSNSELLEISFVINHLIKQHDEHMQATYEAFMSGEDVGEKFAYGAGLYHAIRTMDETLSNMISGS